MRREARLLHGKSLDSLVLAIEHFNRPTDRGRPESVLILLDRSFELLLKAAIVHRGGSIREPKAKETIGFDKCVRKCLSDTTVRCMTEEQALTIQILNSLRDAAQHYLLQVSEQQLYLYTQAGVALYDQIQQDVFGVSLRSQLPGRVLPVTTSPPRDFASLIEAEFKEIAPLVQKGSRHGVEARARLRSLAIVDSSIGGVRSQPGDRDLDRLIQGVRAGTPWQELFPGISLLNLATMGTGLEVSIRLTKTVGEPVQLVPEGTPGATVVAVKRVDELGFYSLGLGQLAEKLNLTEPKTLALVRCLDIQADADCFKEISVGKAAFKRYSPVALDRLKKALPGVDMEEVWERHRPRKSGGATRGSVGCLLT